MSRSMKRMLARFHWPLAFCLMGLILTSCGVPGLPTTAAQLPVVGAPTATQTLPAVHLPQDEAPHRDLTEWWYYTGHFDSVSSGGQQHHYGFELVFFQVLRSDYPPIYAAHFAITDLARGSFQYDQRRLTEPNAVLPNGTSTNGFQVGIGDWSARGLNGQDTLQATMNNYALNVSLHALKPPTLHNGDGLITAGLNGFTYYYSRTRMELSGTLQDHQQRLQISGTAWMDHQWGNFLTQGDGGWDWFSVQLNDQTEAMIYLLRDANGNITSTYASFIGADSHNLLLPEKSLNVTALSHWLSPVTGITYPSGWTIKINDPRLQMAITLQPELKNQELVVTQSTGNTYWEGAVSVQGKSSGHTVMGEGYVELTGYHKSDGTV